MSSYINNFGLNSIQVALYNEQYPLIRQKLLEHINDVNLSEFYKLFKSSKQNFISYCNYCFDHNIDIIDNYPYMHTNTYHYFKFILKYGYNPFIHSVNNNFIKHLVKDIKLNYSIIGELVFKASSVDLSEKLLLYTMQRYKKDLNVHGEDNIVKYFESYIKIENI